MKASNKVIVNTGILYGNMVVNAIIAFISTRWILDTLGKVDFGIYNLVGGIIAMFSFLNVAMVAATQRYISYSLGQNKEDLIKETFKCSVLLHLLIGVVVFLIFELMGDYFMHHKLQIPAPRLSEAMIVLHCLSVSTFFTIITVPYQAVLNARENMLAIALIGIYESIAKLVVAIVLLHYFGDRLVLYAVLMMCMFISSMAINRIYCKIKYQEVKISWRSPINFKLFKQMFAFAGWNFIGSISSLLRNQGLAMLMNSFFGVIINAAYGIATQVNYQAQFFSRTIVRALQPQIVKSEGAGDRTRMVKIALTTCKIPFLMLSLVVAPLIAEMPFILKLWLGNFPDNSVIFCRLILLITLMMQIKMGLSIAIDSVGKIKWYQIVCGGLHFIVLPIAYYLYRIGYSAYWGLTVVFCEEIITIFLTSLFSKRLVGIGLRHYYLMVFLPAVVTVATIFTITYSVISHIAVDWLRLGVFTGIYAALTCWVSYKLILTRNERDIIKSFMASFVRKMTR